VSIEEMTSRSALRKGLPIFVAAINMRAGLTIMGPLFPILKEQYDLSAFQLSFLTSLSVICFAASAFLMPLVARIGGTNHVVAAMLSALTLSILLRTIGNISLLFLSSVAIGIAIAILNFTLPVWVKENTPNHSGLLTGVYITILGLFASLAVAVAVPLAEATTWGWRFSMVPWFIIGAISSIWWLLRVKRVQEPKHMDVTAKFHRTVFKQKGAWSIALFFGLQSMVFYGTASWLPTILVTKGFSLKDASLAVAVSGLIGSMIGIATPHYLSKSKHLRVILLALGLVISVSFTAVIVDSGNRLFLWLVISNIALSTTFPMSLLLTVLRSADANQTRSLSIMSQSVGYVMAAMAPGLVGAIFDSTQNWSKALLVPVFIGIALGVVGFFAGKSEKITI